MEPNLGLKSGKIFWYSFKSHKIYRKQLKWAFGKPFQRLRIMKFQITPIIFSKTKLSQNLQICFNILKRR